MICFSVAIDAPPCKCHTEAHSARVRGSPHQPGLPIRETGVVHESFEWCEERHSYTRRNRWRSASVSAVRSAFSSTSVSAARFQQAGSSHKYAPRPLRLPLGSIWTPASGVRTIRVRVRFAALSRQTTHIRCGMCFGCGLPVLVAIILRRQHPPHHGCARLYVCVWQQPPHESHRR